MPVVSRASNAIHWEDARTGDSDGASTRARLSSSQSLPGALSKRPVSLIFPKHTSRVQVLIAFLTNYTKPRGASAEHSRVLETQRASCGRNTVLMQV